MDRREFLKSLGQVILGSYLTLKYAHIPPPVTGLVITQYDDPETHERYLKRLAEMGLLWENHLPLEAKMFVREYSCACVSGLPWDEITSEGIERIELEWGTRPLSPKGKLHGIYIY